MGREKIHQGAFPSYSDKSQLFGPSTNAVTFKKGQSSSYLS